MLSAGCSEIWCECWLKKVKWKRGVEAFTFIHCWSRKEVEQNSYVLYVTTCDLMASNDCTVFMLMIQQVLLDRFHGKSVKKWTTDSQATALMLTCPLLPAQACVCLLTNPVCCCNERTPLGTNALGGSDNWIPCVSLNTAKVHTCCCRQTGEMYKTAADMSDGGYTATEETSLYPKHIPDWTRHHRLIRCKTAGEHGQIALALH